MTCTECKAIRYNETEKLVSEQREKSYLNGWRDGYQQGREDMAEELLEAINRALRKNGFIWTEHAEEVWKKIETQMKESLENE